MLTILIGHRQKRERKVPNQSNQSKSDQATLSANDERNPNRSSQVKEKIEQSAQVSGLQNFQVNCDSVLTVDLENEETFRLLCEKKMILEAEIRKREAARIEREQDIFLERKKDFQQEVSPLTFSFLILIILKLSRQEEIQLLGSERLSDRIARDDLIKKLNDPIFSSFQKPPSSPLDIDPFGTPNLNEYLNGSGYVDENEVILFVLDIETKDGVRALPVKMGDVAEDLSALFCKQYPSASFEATLAHINQALSIFRF